MASSANSEPYQETSFQEESIYAFQMSYEVLQERYNKLKNEYKKLLKSKTCCRCSAMMQRRTAQVPGNLCLERSLAAAENDSISQPCVGQDLMPCQSPDTADIIRDFKRLYERLSRALSSPASDNDRSSLNYAVASLCELQRQVSYSPEAKSEIEQHLVTSSDNTEITTPQKATFAPSACRADDEGLGNVEGEIYAWISSVNRLNEELQTVYQKLWEQSVVLKNFVAPVLRDASHSTGAKRGIDGEWIDFEDDGWSVYIP